MVCSWAGHFSPGLISKMEGDGGKPTFEVLMTSWNSSTQPVRDVRIHPHTLLSLLQVGDKLSVLLSKANTFTGSPLLLPPLSSIIIFPSLLNHLHQHINISKYTIFSPIFKKKNLSTLLPLLLLSQTHFNHSTTPPRLLFLRVTSSLHGGGQA